MKINLKNRLSWWVLLHINLTATISGFVFFIITWSYQAGDNTMTRLAGSALCAYLSIIIIWFFLGLIKQKVLCCLEKYEAFYLWLEKTEDGAKLGECFWRKKNARYYKIFFGNLPSIRQLHLNNKAIILKTRSKNTEVYFTYWVTLICKLKGTYSANDLYEKMIGVKNVKKTYFLDNWEINGVYHLRKYILIKINQLLMENPQLLAAVEKYKNNQNDREIIRALQQFLLEISPKEILQNCTAIEIVRVKPTINKTAMRSVPLKRFEKLHQKTKPRN